MGDHSHSSSANVRNNDEYGNWQDNSVYDVINTKMSLFEYIIAVASNACDPQNSVVHFA